VFEYKILPHFYRSFRWVYHPQSQYYVSSKAKGTRPLSASSLPDSTGMVDVPISVLQNTLGSQPFNKQSVDITGNSDLIIDSFLY